MCGIAGFISKKPRFFDYSSFCVLGIANDLRGGDSCGIFIDGKYEYGVNNKKYFQEFFLTSPILSTVEKYEIAFLHCRKASVGAINEKTAQPVIIKNNDKVEFVLMHNGTIHNYKELAKKYIPKVDITGYTDSQVMAFIFYYTGYDVLSEYNGGAVFAIADYRGLEPKTFLFKGASPKNYFNVNIEEERPLWYTISDGELIFSSIGSYLLALRPYDDTYNMQSNYLLEFDGKKLIPIKKIDRSNCSQSAQVYTQPVFTSKYIIVDADDIVYKVHGVLAHGRYDINSYGRIFESPSKVTHEVWFFNGVALKNFKCYRFLVNLMREYKMKLTDFYLLYENLIRYLSIDNIYPINGVYFTATSPKECKVFTGSNQMITSSAVSQYLNGKRTSTSYGGGKDSIDDKLTLKVDEDFKELKNYVCN